MLLKDVLSFLLFIMQSTYLQSTFVIYRYSTKAKHYWNKQIPNQLEFHYLLYTNVAH